MNTHECECEATLGNPHERWDADEDDEETMQSVGDELVALEIALYGEAVL